MILLDASATMPTTPWEWFKVVAPLLTGGVVGALITAFLTDRRNRIQPVSTRLKISTVDIPAIMPGYYSAITLTSTTDDCQYHFGKLSTVQIELINSGNKDLDYLEFGITLSASSGIIGVQHESQDRYHQVSHTPEISIDEPSTTIDFKLAPFHRRDTYTVTLVVSSPSDSSPSTIELIRKQPIRFVDADAAEKAMISAINKVADSPFSTIGWPVIPIIRRMTDHFKG